MILPATLFFIFGTIIGSFLNVVILRYNSGRSIVSGRSSCLHCRHELGFLELVPLFSFLALRGRCLKCRSRISWQYPLVEFLTGLIFLGVYLKYSSINLLYMVPDFPFLILSDLVIFSLLIVILVYDLKHKIIPDGLVYAFIVLSFIKLIIVYPVGGLFHFPLVLDLLAGPIMFIPFFLLWFFSGGRWMGFGDAKLAFGIGWFLGFVGSISGIILGFWSGAAIGLLLLAYQSFSNRGRLKNGAKKLTIKSEIPFAPFLILGLFLVYFFGFDLTGLHLLLVH